MNISHPDVNSEVYHQFMGMINQKVSQAAVWLANHNIEYAWNYYLGDHLYRLYIPCKELLLDFEYYPINNYDYNYIRINFDMDIIQLLERIFPNTIFDTNNMEVWKLNQLPVNKFLRNNGAAPVYDKNVIRLGYVRRNTIYQCIILKDNKIIRNVTKRNCCVTFGTLVLLRQLNEAFGITNIQIMETVGDTYANAWYQMLGVPCIAQSHKKKIWWSPASTRWKIKKEDTNKYVPFYYCEDRIYQYPG